MRLLWDNYPPRAQSALKTQLKRKYGNIMIYYTHAQKTKMQELGLDAVLQTYFPNNRWGVCASFCSYFKNDDGIDIVEICRVDNYTNTWEHYAQIIRFIDKTGKQVFEVSEISCGAENDELWIYGEYSSFAYAVRNIALKGTSENGRKPIKKC